MNKQLVEYLKETIDKKPDWVEQLEVDAKENNVPIMEPLGIEFLMQMVRLKRPTRILEIGTAIGYSSLRMLEAYPDTQIVTVERDYIRYEQALRNIQGLNKQDNITVIFGDALEKVDEIKQLGTFDMLFIDAAKGQYQRFFEMYSEMLSSDGLIVSDNVLFKAMVADDTIENQRLQKIASKLRSYNHWLTNHPKYKTTIVPIGDGVAISVKRQEG